MVFFWTMGRTGNFCDYSLIWVFVNHIFVLMLQLFFGRVNHEINLYIRPSVNQKGKIVSLITFATRIYAGQGGKFYLWLHYFFSRLKQISPTKLMLPPGFALINFIARLIFTVLRDK